MMISSPFISGLFSTILQKLVSLLEGEVPALLGVKDELEDLHSRMAKMEILIKQAEAKALTDTSINTWLLELQDATYIIDDIIDDCGIEARSLDQPITAPSTPRATSTAICSCLSCDITCFSSKRPQHRISEMIKVANDKLRKIEQGEERYGLLSFVEGVQHAWTDQVQARMTTHSPVETLGEAIKKDVKEIVEWLTSEGIQKHEDGKLVRVMVIVGKAGVGKTKLAQRVFHHPAIESGCFFKKRMWVSMPSKALDEKSMLLEMVREMVGINYAGVGLSIRELLEVLKDVVAAKDILLIMDGVHDDNSWENWLSALLEVAGDGSRVLITTRCQEVCAKIPTSQLRRLQVMLESDALLLLCKNAFSCNEEEKDLQDLMEIGVEIVKKCQCIPQAVETIGRVLRSKPRERVEWEVVLRHAVWSLDLMATLDANQNHVDVEVINALVISYLDLPLPHKQCLIYCSMFPENHDFNKQPTVEYWIAENLLKIEDVPQMEIMGEKVFNGLIDRGFLVSNFNCKDGKKIHNLMHLLANLLCKEENFYGNRKDINKRSIRRSSFTDENSLGDYNLTKHHERLRTMMFFNSPELREIPKSLFKKLQYLRVLGLRGTGIEMLPNSIKYLVHLKLLDVSFTPIKSLPEQLGDLCSLMFLLLMACKSLHALPNSIVKLQSLCTINLSNTAIRQMPRMIRELKQLQVLVWRVEEDKGEAASWSAIEELFHLVNLTELSLRNLENLNGAQKAKEARLQDKIHLRSLHLCCELPSGCIDEEGVRKIEEVFEGLQPPPCLKDLQMSGFYGHNMPSWISSLGELRKIRLENCKFCRKLPCLGQMGQLKELIVNNATSIVVLGPEFFLGGGSQQPFSKLELMSFQGLPNLEECCFDGVENNESCGGSPFMHLKDLRFIDCPKLSLLWGCLSRATSLSTLHLKNLENLEAIPDLPTLKMLSIANCPALSRIGMLETLEDVHWADDTNQVLSPWLGLLKSHNVTPRAPSLQNVYINTTGCRLLRRLCPWEIGVDWSLIMNVDHVGAYCPNTPFFLEFNNTSPMRVRGRLPKGRFDFEGSALRSIAEGDVNDHIFREFQRRIKQEFGASSSGLQEEGHEVPAAVSVQGESSTSRACTSMPSSDVACST